MMKTGRNEQKMRPIKEESPKKLNLGFGLLAMRMSEREGIRTPDLQLRRLLPYPD